MRRCCRESRTGAVSTLVAVCACATCLSLFPRFSPGWFDSNRLTVPPPPTPFSSLAIDRLQPNRYIDIAAPARATPRRRSVPAAPREADTSREAAASPPDTTPPLDASVDAPVEEPARDVPLETPAIANSLALSDGIVFGGTGSRRMRTRIASAIGGDRRVPRSMRTMYVALGGLEAADVQLTLTALGGGAREANPLMSPVAGHPAALVGIKAASVVGTIYFVERLRTRHPFAAAVTMAAIDAGFVGVVVHNSRVAVRAPTR